MKSGTLTELLTVEEKTETVDAQGGTLTTWASIGTVRAALRPKSEALEFESERIVHEREYGIQIRFFPGLDSNKHRLKMTNGTPLQIRSLLDRNNRHREHVIVGVEAL